MLGHFILNCDYKGKTYRIEKIHRSELGEITHLSIFPLKGQASEIKVTKVPAADLDLHQVS